MPGFTKYRPQENYLDFASEPIAIIEIAVTLYERVVLPLHHIGICALVAGFEPATEFHRVD